MRVAHSRSVILISVFLVQLVLSSEDELVVRVKNGLLKGAAMETTNGRTFLGFMGIRYAKPPLGPLRFQPPMPMDDWDGTKDATEVHNMCIQRDIFTRLDKVEGVEDCLFLNVYTPKIVKKDLLPVMMFIHGGGFLAGSGSKLMYGPETLLDKDIVLVTINYRLGPLGFFTTGDEVVPGNNGMKDQNLALQWIKENIKNFGGDSKSVTIFGESAGGASTHLHLFSPLSKGLFHGGISQSGTAFGRWAIQPLRKGVSMGRQLARSVNCPLENSSEMIECLRKVDAKDLINQQQQFLEWDIEPAVIFAPVVEPKHKGAFISDTPENIIKNRLGSDVPWMSGITTEDGAIRSAAILAIPQLLKEFNEKFSEIGHVILFMEQSKKTKEVSRKLWTYYFGRGDVDVSDTQALTDLYTDAYFTSNNDYAVSLHKQYRKQPVYNYLFGFRGSMSLSELFGTSDTDFGVCHGDELLYLFPLHKTLLPGKQTTESDKNMSELLTTLWTNFATHKNPTPHGDLKHKWNSVESADNEYLHIKRDQSLVMEKKMFKERVDFWKTLAPLLEVSQHTKDEL